MHCIRLSIIIIIVLNLFFSACNVHKTSIVNTNTEKNYDLKWELISNKDIVTYDKHPFLPKKFLTYSIVNKDTAFDRLKKYCKKETEISVSKSDMLLELPCGDDKFRLFQVVETTTMSEELAKKYPAFKTYAGFDYDPVKKTDISARFEFNNDVFKGMITDGGNVIFITPYTLKNSGKTVYLCYYKKDVDNHDLPFEQESPHK